MLQAVVKWSLLNRPVVIALAAMLFVAGLHAAFNAQLDAFPEFAPPQVIVQTEAPGLSASEVEQLVTLPIEQSVTGVPGLEFMRSRSIQGLSMLTVVFRDDVNIYLARQLVAERLTEVANQLPDGVETPRLGPLTKTTGRLVVFAFTSDTASAMTVRDRVQWVVRPRLLAVKGVAQVTLFGGEVRQFQVQVDPEALAARRLTINDVVEATKQASAIRGAGFQENDSQRLVIRTEGQVFTPEQLGETLIARSQGTPIRLRDVARVVEGPEPKFGDALVNGQPGVALFVEDRDDSGHTWSATLRLSPDVFPLKTHRQFEDLLHRELADPLSGLLSALHARPKGCVDARITLVIRPCRASWYRLAGRVVARIERSFAWDRLGYWFAKRARSPQRFVRGVAWIVGRLARRAESSYDAADARDKLNKHLFETHLVLAVCCAKNQETAAHDAFTELAGAFGRFTSHRVVFGMSKPRHGIPKRNGRGFLLSAEELATLWHPPTANVRTAKLRRAPKTSPIP